MNESQFREYRLGRLDADQLHEFELHAFEQDGFDDQLRAAEHDLLDDWARGRLPEPDRIAVEQCFSPSQLAIARSLTRTSVAKPRPRRHLPFAAAAAVLIALAPAAYFYQHNRQLQQALQSANQRLAPLPGPSPQPFTIALQHKTTRGSAIPSIIIPAGTDSVRFTIDPIAGHSRYEVRVESATRGLVFSQTSAATPKLTLTIPASLLTPGDYDFLVSGFDGGAANLLATYPVRIATQ